MKHLLAHQAEQRADHRAADLRMQEARQTPALTEGALGARPWRDEPGSIAIRMIFGLAATIAPITGLDGTAADGAHPMQRLVGGIHTAPRLIEVSSIV